jgi:hypothetical protein
LRNTLNAQRKFEAEKARSEADESLNETQRQRQIGEFNDSFRRGSFEVDNNHSNSMFDFASKFLTYFPHLYRKLLKDAPPSTTDIPTLLSTLYSQDPVKTAQAIQDEIDSSGFDKEFDASRVILILGGNDQDFLAQAVARARDKNDPDSVHEAGAALVREKGGTELARKYLTDRLGDNPNTAAFLSRLGTFEHKLPLSSFEIRNMVHSMLTEFQKRVQSDFAARGIPIEKIDVSEQVVQHFYEELKRHHLDPRLMLDRISENMAFLQKNMLDQIYELPEGGTLPDAINVGLGPSGLDVTATATKQGKLVAIASHTMSLTSTHAIAQVSNPLNPTLRPESKNLRNLKAANLASTAVVGSLIFGSVPKQLSLQDNEFLNTDFSKLWEKADLENLAYQRNLFLVRLAGIAGEMEYMEETLPSERARKDRFAAESLLHSILNDIAELKRLRRPSATPETVRLADILPNRYREYVFDEIGNGLDPSEILFKSIEHVRKLLRDNKSLVEKMAHELKTSDVLEGDRIQDTFLSMKRPVYGSAIRQIVRAEPGSVGDNPCRLALQRLGFLGRIQNRATVYYRRLLGR